MVQVSRGGFPSWLVLAINLVAMALVVSFLLFEVLDVDGSTFPVPSGTATAAAEPVQPNDIKRTSLHGPADIPIDLTTLPVEPLGQAVQLRWTQRFPASPVLSPRAHGYREILPRAALPHAPPGA